MPTRNSFGPKPMFGFQSAQFTCRYNVRLMCSWSGSPCCHHPPSTGIKTNKSILNRSLLATWLVGAWQQLQLRGVEKQKKQKGMQRQTMNALVVSAHCHNDNSTTSHLLALNKAIIVTFKIMDWSVSRGIMKVGCKKLMEQQQSNTIFFIMMDDHAQLEQMLHCRRPVDIVITRNLKGVIQKGSRCDLHKSLQKVGKKKWMGTKKETGWWRMTFTMKWTDHGMNWNQGRHKRWCMWWHKWWNARITKVEWHQLWRNRQCGRQCTRWDKGMGHSCQCLSTCDHIGRHRSLRFRLLCNGRRNILVQNQRMTKRRLHLQMPSLVLATEKLSNWLKMAGPCSCLKIKEKQANWFQVSELKFCIDTAHKAGCRRKLQIGCKSANLHSASTELTRLGVDGNCELVASQPICILRRQS